MFCCLLCYIQFTILHLMYFLCTHQFCMCCLFPTPPPPTTPTQWRVVEWWHMDQFGSVSRVTSFPSYHLTGKPFWSLVGFSMLCLCLDFWMCRLHTDFAVVSRQEKSFKCVFTYGWCLVSRKEKSFKCVLTYWWFVCFMVTWPGWQDVKIQ